VAGPFQGRCPASEGNDRSCPEKPDQHRLIMARQNKGAETSISMGFWVLCAENILWLLRLLLFLSCPGFVNGAGQAPSGWRLGTCPAGDIQLAGHCLAEFQCCRPLPRWRHPGRLTIFFQESRVSARVKRDDCYVGISLKASNSVGLAIQKSRNDSLGGATANCFCHCWW
jgi:hypothetical protein